MRMQLRSAVSYEEKWARKWLEDRVFEADPQPSKPKVFVTFPYSYQNGPLHVGHGFTATRVDTYARFMRMKGYNVLFPWAWHWTGEAVAGTVERLKRGDPNVIRMLRDIDKIPDEQLHQFTDPAYVCRYYTSENREVVKLIGFSVDWRREFYTSDLHPYYSRFIEWQYRTLYRLGRLRKGSHPVVWCPVCESPTGDHDRLVGEGVSPIEFTLVYFRLEESDAYLAASTLRPETIFGATNVWVRPEAKYAEATLNGAKVIVSQEALVKMREQQRRVSVEREVSGRELVGKYCFAPITNKRLIVLPADFVDPNLGSGVVYSVPSHAPYDYAGLKELRLKPEKLKHYGLDPSLLDSLQPINIISTPGLSAHPAVDVVEREGISSSTDPKLEKLTQEVYAKEFYGGLLNSLCGDLEGESVKNARDLVKSRLIEQGLGSILYDLPQPVICRSGDRCLVKIVEDQWFITYGDEDWKDIVRTHISKNMQIYPEGARQWFLNVVDWLNDWPCTRKTGLGTRFPYDTTWIVETLSDSTIYQALYTVSKYLNEGLVNPQQLSDEFFDYVFRGIGDRAEVSRITGIKEELIDAIRAEFEYWYPVDLRVSAKELLPNHLTFYIFQHIALFSPEKWPRSVGVNGVVRIEGEEMHKSRGKFVSLKEAISRVGADATRLAVILSAEEMDDPDWRWKNAEDVRAFLDSFLRLLEEYRRARIEGDWQEADYWSISRLKQLIGEVEQNLLILKTRTAASKTLYEMDNLWKKYLRRRGGTLGPASKIIIESWIKMLAPFAPFTAEEAWSLIGGQGYVSLSGWPELKEPQDEELLLRDEILERVVEDARNIIQATKRRPSKIYLYVASESMIEAIEKTAKILMSQNREARSELMRELAKLDLIDKRRIPVIANNLAESLTPFIHRYNLDKVKKVARSEAELYLSNLRYLEHELGAPVKVFEARNTAHDPMGKASSAVPLRPGIYTE